MSTTIASRIRSKIPFSRVVCDGNELAYVKEVLDSGWLTTSSKAMAFEKAFAERVGAKHAIAVNSATAALHLGLEAMGVGPGDEVLVPTMTFTATAEVVRYLDAEPVFLDVEYGSSLLTPETVARAVAAHPRAKVLIPVHFAGQAARMMGEHERGILDVCKSRGIRVLEDAAHAFPASRDGRKVGAMGDATCFSFYANKTITCGEGGMLTTDDDAIAARVKVMRLHGIDRDVWARFTSDRPSWEYDVIAPGYKYNLPDLAAAVGLAQLERADAMREARQRLAEQYQRRLADLATVDLPLIQVAPEDHAWHLFVIIVRPEAPIGRNDLIHRLSDLGIGTSVPYKPVHRMTYYRDRYQLDPADYPEAERIWNGCLALPLYPMLDPEDVDAICDCLIDLLSD